MLSRNLISNSIPYLHLNDKVYHALQLMNDYHVAHLPVVADEIYLGIVSEELLLHANDEQLVSELPMEDGGSAVGGNEHFLKAIQIAVQYKLSIVPVVDNQQLLGIITYTDLLQNAAQFMSLGQPGGLLVLETEGKDYSLSEINRIVESNDAQITQLNTSLEPESGNTEITIRVSKLEISDIVSTFQRFEYNVKYYFGEEAYENQLRTNYDNLMNYLEI